MKPELHSRTNRIGAARVPRTRSSHDFSARTVAKFGFKSGTRIIVLPVSFSIPKFAQRSLQTLANFGIGTLAGIRPGLPGMRRPPSLGCNLAVAILRPLDRGQVSRRPAVVRKIGILSRGQ